MHEPNNDKCSAYAYTSLNNNINGMPWFHYTIYILPYLQHPSQKAIEKCEIRISDVCEILSYNDLIKSDINNDGQYFNTTLLLDVMTVLDAAAKDKSQLP